MFSLISRSWKSPYRRSRVQNRAARQRDEQRRAGTGVHLAETSNVLLGGRLFFICMYVCMYVRVCMSVCVLAGRCPKRSAEGVGAQEL